jgi:hypothetical protein
VCINIILFETAFFDSDFESFQGCTNAHLAETIFRLEYTVTQLFVPGLWPENQAADLGHGGTGEVRDYSPSVTL